MEIANGVEMLELKVEAFGHQAVLNPTLVWDKETAVLIDAGMPGGAGQIRAAMEEAGVTFEKLKAVIVTHQDLDHIGSLPEILQECPGCVEVYAHELDKPYIEGDLPQGEVPPNSARPLAAYGGSKQSGDPLHQDHCFRMGASVPKNDEGVVYIYRHRPASDFEGVDKKPHLKREATGGGGSQ